MLRGGCGYRWLFLAAVFAAPAFAEVNVDSVLAELSDTSFAKRQAATQRLMSDPTLTSDQIDALYAHAETEEARQRLIDVARHQLLWNIARERYGMSDKASLGVSLEGVTAEQAGNLGKPAVYINRTCPGFPAFVVLDAGDLILSIDGKRPEGLVDTSDVREFFIRQIQSHKPGENVILEVRRGGRTLEQPVTLSSLDALAAMYLNTAGAQPQVPPNMPPAPAPFVINGGERQQPLHEKFDLLWIARLRELLAAGK